MSICLCCEASHVFGMGHLYRMLNLGQVLRERGEETIFVVNRDDAAARVLHGQGVSFLEQDFSASSGWEAPIIQKYHIRVWVNDRLQTGKDHARYVGNQGAKLVTFDDFGEGAAFADLHIAALPAVYERYKPEGKRVLQGLPWLVLNPRLSRLRRQREKIDSRAVCLGGSDTYGVTVRIAELLRAHGLEATYFVGPAFRHEEELARVAPVSHVRRSVTHLLDELAAFDLAITGGGMIAFESAAMGLPVIIVANEEHETCNARLLERLGCAHFAGHYKDLSFDTLVRIPDVRSLSRAGIETVTLNGVENIATEIVRI